MAQLIVQPTDRALRRAGMIVLDERCGYAGVAVAHRMVALEEEAARVAEHSRLDDYHTGQLGGNRLHASSSRIERRYCAYALDRKSTRLNSSHGSISYAVFC